MVLKRVLTACSYYNHLDTINNINDRLIFINFMDSIYKQQVYDDYFHLTRFHKNDIESIIQFAINSYSFSACDLSTCSYSDRHFRIDQTPKENESTNDSNENDNEMKYFDIHTEIMDSLHFYLFHLIDGGLRECKMEMFE